MYVVNLLFSVAGHVEDAKLKINMKKSIPAADRICRE